MNYGIDPTQLRAHIIVPALGHLGLLSDAAVNLVLGTALKESNGTYLKQLGTGPALGLWQMEPNTHNDVWDNFLKYSPHFTAIMKDFAGDTSPQPNHMVGNLWYACGMARVHYYRVKAPIPAADDAQGLTEYWKQYYNTPKGAGVVPEALKHFEFACKL